MLTPTRVDTNSLFLTEKLNLLGVEVAQKMIVGDNLWELEASIRYCLDHVQLVILTGGLGLKMTSRGRRRAAPQIED